MKFKFFGYRLKSIADYLERRKLPLCEICKKYPQREITKLKTCSLKCSNKIYDKSIKGKEARKRYYEKHRKEIIFRLNIHNKALWKLKNKHKEEYLRIFKKLKKSVIYTK